MPKQVLAYGARAANASLEPMTIERRDPAPHDVEIKILYCGICHSDLHKVRNDWGSTHYPIVPGHEIIGRVAALGSEASRYREGDLVGVGCLVDSCRACPACKAGHEMFCEQGATISFDSPEKGRNTWSYGGYSTSVVVDERYVLRMPKTLDPAKAAPLLCGGITTYSPLRQFGCKPGVSVAVVGLGGLGHLAVRLAASMGAEVTVISTSRAKERDATRLGARRFIAMGEREALDTGGGRFDLILDTVSGPHDLDALAGTLRSFGTLVLVGLPGQGAPVDATGLIHGNKRVAGSNIGGIPETQEMLDYCGEHGIVADIETISASQINDAYARMDRGDVRYRFVIDLTGLHGGGK
jgi:uncharacterized zinc-type alcohol dehydrogenase-like protein